MKPPRPGSLAEKLLNGWNAGQTFAQNIRRLRIKPGTGYNYVHSYKLKFARKRKGSNREVLEDSPQNQTNHQERVRRLVAQFREGGRGAKKAARELKKLGVTARLAEEQRPENVFPFVMARGMRQMPPKSRFGNPNWGWTREQLRAAEGMPFEL